MNTFKQYIEEKHQIPQKYYYHGTSDKYLNHIMSGGLNYSSSKSKFLQTGGINQSDAYLTQIPLRAMMYATERSEEYYPKMYNPVIVKCILSPYSGYLDEDHFAALAWSDTNMSFEEYMKNVDNKIRDLLDNVKIKFNHELDRNIWYELYKDNIKLHKVKGGYNNKKVEQRMFYNIEKLTRIYKKYTIQSPNIRIVDNISFSGRNRIIGIFKFNYIDDSTLLSDPIKIYGDDNIYAEMKKLKDEFNLAQ